MKQLFFISCFFSLLFFNLCAENNFEAKKCPKKESRKHCKKERNCCDLGEPENVCIRDNVRIMVSNRNIVLQASEDEEKLFIPFDSNLTQCFTPPCTLTVCEQGFPEGRLGLCCDGGYNFSGNLRITNNNVNSIITIWLKLPNEDTPVFQIPPQFTDGFRFDRAFFRRIDSISSDSYSIYYITGVEVGVPINIITADLTVEGSGIYNCAENCCVFSLPPCIKRR